MDISRALYVGRNTNKDIGNQRPQDIGNQRPQ